MKELASVRYGVLTAATSMMAVFRAIVLMKEAVSTSEKSVNFYNNPEDNHLRVGKDTKGSGRGLIQGRPTIPAFAWKDREKLRISAIRTAGIRAEI
jgi:hypothetical protein